MLMSRVIVRTFYSLLISKLISSLIGNFLEYRHDLSALNAVLVRHFNNKKNCILKTYETLIKKYNVPCFTRNYIIDSRSHVKSR